MASFGNEKPLPATDLIDFYEYIYDRHLVWHNRFVKHLPRPWTENKILDKYKFCNVYRELDPGTKYLIKRICENDSLSFAEKVFNILSYRIYNQVGLFDDYFSEPLSLENFDFKRYEKELDAAKAKGKNLFNNAYNITQRTFCDEYRKKEKHVQHLLNLQNIGHETLIATIGASTEAKDVFEAIKSLNFFGPFLAYQCCTDISYIPGNTINWNEFVCVGPGAKGSITAMFATKRLYEEKCIELYLRQGEMFAKLLDLKGKDWMQIAYLSPYNDKRFLLSLSNIQNCCCEFRKYLNYRNGIKGRKKYYKQNIKATENPYAAVEAEYDVS